MAAVLQFYIVYNGFSHKVKERGPAAPQCQTAEVPFRVGRPHQSQIYEGALPALMIGNCASFNGKSPSDLRPVGGAMG